jgi:linoleoyl-CoA desaturase
MQQSIKPVTTRIISKQELGLHNNSCDCWLAIDGDVYDVTAWLEDHPGGDVLSVLAGEDASEIFYSSHLQDLRPYMQRFKVGRLDTKGDTQELDDIFLQTLQSRVRDFFQETAINHRNTQKNKLNIALTACLFLVSWCCLYFFPPWGCLAIIPMGFCTCALIGSFGHESIHGNLNINSKRYPAASKLLKDIAWGVFIPFMPEHFFRYEHIKHHKRPLDPAYDYDVLALRHFVRLSEAVEAKRHHAAQHYYAPFIYGIYIFIQILEGYRTHFFQSRGLLNEKGVTSSIIVSSLCALTFHIALPIYLTGFWWAAACSFAYFFTWQASIYLTSGAPHMTRPEIHNPNLEPWSKRICETTCNLKCGNRFFDWLTGGLNYHLTHHLLSSIPRDYLAEVTALVEKTCNDFDYPCYTYSSFIQYCRDHYKYLHAMGRSNHTVDRSEDIPAHNPG